MRERAKGSREGGVSSKKNYRGVNQDSALIRAVSRLERSMRARRKQRMESHGPRLNRKRAFCLFSGFSIYDA